MHKRLIDEGFNRRYVLTPLLLSIALVVAGFGITEWRRYQTSQIDSMLRQRQDAMQLLSEAVNRSLEAESAQRGFLLTGEQQYIAPMELGLENASRTLDQLAHIYADLDPEQVRVIERAHAELAEEAVDMRESVSLLQQGQAARAIALLKSDPGLRMQAITAALGGLRLRERESVLNGLGQWNAAMRLNTYIGACGTLFTIGVLIVLGLLATRDIRRREGFATDLATQIDTRTSELRELSRHMSRVAEAEKHALARELHDELGGLLVAMRMDISQIRKRQPANDDPQLQPHWERVEQALAAGLELKRRVIEELRPTLLDNMGLFTALRWLASQSAEQAQLQLEMFGLDEDIDLPPETAIAVFRTVQEAIANTVKHSGATRLAVTAEVGASYLVVRVSDNGCGMPPDAERRTGSHGLKQMRFRMESVDGTLAFRSREPTGTTMELTVPLQTPMETPAA